MIFRAAYHCYRKNGFLSERFSKQWKSAMDLLTPLEQPEDRGTAAAHHGGPRTQFQQTPPDRF